MASRGKGAREKGFQFERDMAKALTENTDYSFKRGLGQSRGGGGEVPDVLPEDIKLHESIHIECKRRISCSIKSAMKQAETDIAKRIAKKKKLSKEIKPFPIVITKDDRKDTLVTIKLKNFLSMFDAWLSAEL